MSDRCKMKFDHKNIKIKDAIFSDKKTDFQDTQRNIRKETQKHLLEGSSVVTQVSPPDEYSRNPSVTVYQLVV